MRLYFGTLTVVCSLITATACSMKDLAVYLKCGTVNSDIQSNPETCEGSTQILVDEVDKSVGPPEPVLE